MEWKDGDLVDFSREAFDDTQAGCLRHAKLLGYDYAVLWDGDCYVTGEEEFVSSLTAADDAAASCNVACDDDEDSELTCGGDSHLEVFQYVAPPVEEEEDEETSASYIVGVASAILASAVSLA